MPISANDRSMRISQGSFYIQDHIMSYHYYRNIQNWLYYRAPAIIARRLHRAAKKIFWSVKRKTTCNLEKLVKYLISESSPKLTELAWFISVYTGCKYYYFKVTLVGVVWIQFNLSKGILKNGISITNHENTFVFLRAVPVSSLHYNTILLYTISF